MTYMAETFRDRTGVDTEGYFTAISFAGLMGGALFLVLWIA